MFPNRWSPELLERIIQMASRPCLNPSGAKRAREHFIRFMSRAAGLALTWISLFGNGAATAQECLQCHATPNLNPQRPGLTISSRDFENSVHGSLGCAGCHADVSDFPHVMVQKPQCGTCHPEVVAQFDSSIHGAALIQGDRDAPSCQNCHGSLHSLRAASDPESPVYHLKLPRTCSTCHDDVELARRHNISITNSYQLYMDSIHGRAITRSGLLVAANCSSCHGAHEIQAKDNPDSKVYRTNVPATCGTCHAGVLTVYLESVHGRALLAGGKTAPVCIDCHTAHAIVRVDTAAWQLEIVQECGTCHKESLRTYRDTFHGQVTALGFARVARCSDCHGSHEILPVSDPNSPVHPANRVTTCQKCHPQATANFAKFSPHADPADKQKNPGLYYSALFMNGLMVSVFAFFGLHTILWLVRSLLERAKAGKPPEEQR